MRERCVTVYYGEIKNMRNLRKPFNSETERIGNLELSYIVNKETS